MEVAEAILRRRSIRRYTSEDVGEEDVREMLEAGRWAPSGLNNQPWRFKALRGGEKDAVAEHTKYGHIIRAAPVCVAVFLDDEESYDRTKDVQAVGACIQNMLLRAYDLGLGAVWLGEILNQREQVEEALDVRQELMAVIALGHPAEEADSSRQDLEDLTI